MLTRGDLFAGLVVAFAGGCLGMIWAATGAMSLVMVTPVKDHGLQYLLAATMAVVGLLESMMTASIIDDFTDTRSNKSRKCVGQGVTNIATSFIGGTAGCAMIGQSMINVKSGGRGRLATFAAGFFLVVFLGPWVKQIPMAARVAAMISVSIGTFSWDSIRKLREHPTSSSLVMIAAVVVTVSTHDLAKGVFVARLLRIDVSHAHFWDITAISAFDKVVMKFKLEGTPVEVVGLNDASATLVDQYALHDKPGAAESAGH